MKVVDKYYYDSNTFVAVFDSQIDEYNLSFHYEADYTEDDDKWVVVKVYEDGLMNEVLDDIPYGIIDIAMNAKNNLE